jgi:hypothetical protein
VLVLGPLVLVPDTILPVGVPVYLKIYGFDACDGFGTDWGRAAGALNARIREWSRANLLEISFYLPLLPTGHRVPVVLTLLSLLTESQHVTADSVLSTRVHTYLVLPGTGTEKQRVDFDLWGNLTQ